MPAQILDGKALAQTIRNEIKESTQAFMQETAIQPGLAVVLVGENPASQVYVRNKCKACEEVGFYSVRHDLSAEISQDELLQLIEQLNQDPKIHGILVQLPLPSHIDTNIILTAVNPLKDVDGFHRENTGNLWNGADALVPCTPLGVIEILKRANIPIKGNHAVIIGRSTIVGKPLAALLLEQHATVTICHSRTEDLPGFCRMADILVAAVGKLRLVKGDWVKPGAAVIDVGINFEEIDGKFKQRGDVDKDEVMQVAGYLSPSPGGPGPMTIAMLLNNTLKAAKWQTN